MYVVSVGCCLRQNYLEKTTKTPLITRTPVDECTKRLYGKAQRNTWNFDCVLKYLLRFPHCIVHIVDHLHYYGNRRQVVLLHTYISTDYISWNFGAVMDWERFMLLLVLLWDMDNGPEREIQFMNVFHHFPPAITYGQWSK